MSKTIEELERDVWGEPEFNSGLVQSIHRLRKKPVDQFTIEELRLMIGQNEGTRFLLPRALGLLEQNPLVWDYHYPGELLAQLLRLPDDYWAAQPEHLSRALVALDQAEREVRVALEKRRTRHEDETAWLSGRGPARSSSADDVEESLLHDVRAFIARYRPA